jgi:uncharacterized protein YlzI (FlbEa/FlbD family)
MRGSSMINYMSIYDSKTLEYAAIFKDYSLLFDELYSGVSMHEKFRLYSIGGTGFHRGYYCPNPAIEKLISNEKRGRLISNVNNNYDYAYIFDVNNQLICVESFFGHVTRTNPSSIEFIFRFDQVELGVSFLINTDGSTIGIIALSQCTYKNNKLVDYTYILRDPHSSQASFKEITFDQFEYRNDSLICTRHSRYYLLFNKAKVSDDDLYLLNDAGDPVVSFSCPDNLDIEQLINDYLTGKIIKPDNPKKTTYMNIPVNMAEQFLKNRLDTKNSKIDEFWSVYKLYSVTKFNEYPDREIFIEGRCEVVNNSKQYVLDFIRQYSAEINSSIRMIQIHCEFVFTITSGTNITEINESYFESDGDIWKFYKKIEKLKTFKILNNQLPASFKIYSSLI